MKNSQILGATLFLVACGTALASEPVDYDSSGMAYLRDQFLASYGSVSRQSSVRARPAATLAPTGDAFSPYRVVARCPDGTTAVRIDWPEAGDRLCRDSRDPARLLAAQPDDEALPYRSVGRCAPGTVPIITNSPKLGDRACRKEGESPAIFAMGGDGKAGRRLERCPKGTAAVVSNRPAMGDLACRAEGEAPATRMRTNDPFTPYAVVSECPGSGYPAVINWPKPGDMICEDLPAR